VDIGLVSMTVLGICQSYVLLHCWEQKQESEGSYFPAYTADDNDIDPKKCNACIFSSW
jgi:hypothetical protein